MQSTLLFDLLCYIFMLLYITLSNTSFLTPQFADVFAWRMTFARVALSCHCSRTLRGITNTFQLR